MLPDHVCNIVMSSIVKTKEYIFTILQINISFAQTKKKKKLDLKKQRSGKSNNVIQGRHY